MNAQGEQAGHAMKARRMWGVAFGLTVFVSAAVLVDARLALWRVGESLTRMQASAARIEQRLTGGELAQLGDSE